MAKKRKCCFCKEYSEVLTGIITPVGFFCNIEHASLYARKKQKAMNDKAIKKKQRDEAKRQREKKIEARPRAWYLNNCQYYFNKFIRLRDKDLVCISCGSATKKINAGHYKSVGSSPELRYNELNVHRQCIHCNLHKSGNIGEYRINLIKKIGIEKVEWLEGYHEPKKYTIEELKELIAYYKAKCKELKDS